LNPVAAVAYHYCDFSYILTLSPAVIVKSLAYQLLTSGDIPPSIEDLILRLVEDKLGKDSTPRALQLFHAAVCHHTSVFIIIDGLDELADEDRYLLLDSLRNVVESKSQGIKIFLTSRSDDFAVIFDRLQNRRVYTSIRMTSFLVSQDMSNYVRNAIDELLSQGSLILGDPRLADEIYHALVNGANGM
jgi:hypothetical protein